MNTYEGIKRDLWNLADEERAALCQRYFKTRKGEYGEGDQFIGVAVPGVRRVARKHKEASLVEIKICLQSKIHEERLCALIILTEKYVKAEEKEQKSIYNLYLKNLKYVNNWDLVDQSAPRIVGRYLLDKPKDILYKLVKSKNIWERRVAILSTLNFIVNNKYTDTLKIAEILLFDSHDLIHKAVGWMLREVGKRDLKVEESFLKKHYKTMPRTMLRYAIEKFPEEKRQIYLKGLK
jgi:3-methyladenine DNA glycosylase AlkD